MRNLRNLGTVEVLLGLNKEIRETIEKINGIIVLSTEIFDQEELLEKLEESQENLSRFEKITKDNNNPCISDAELVNSYSDYLTYITNYYLALNGDMLKRSIKEEEWLWLWLLFHHL